MRNLKWITEKEKNDKEFFGDVKKGNEGHGSKSRSVGFVGGRERLQEKGSRESSN